MEIWTDVSLVSSLRLYMLNHLLCSSSTNENVFPPKRVSLDIHEEESCPPSRTRSFLTCVCGLDSASLASVLYHQQQDISVSRHVHRFV
jgi:hypothetical protein